MNLIRKISVLIFVLFAANEAIAFSPRTDGVFVENSGYADSDVQFFAEGNNCEVWITADEIVLDFFEYAHANVDESIRRGVVGKMKFLGSKKFDIEAIGEKNFRYNYFRDGSQAKISRAFAELKIDIYEGISLHTFFENNNLRFDFELEPGANPNDIEISFSGFKDFAIINEKLVSESKFGDIVIREPATYQNGNLVESKFKINAGTICFELGEYDPKLPTTIDPIIFSTYLGGSNYDYAEAVQLDRDSNIYVAGYANSPDFPTTEGAYQDFLREDAEGYPDAFVSKFTPDGSELIYSTFIGGYLDDFATDLFVDDFGGVYFTGYCGKSSRFPTTEGAFDTTHNGGYDAFVVKLDTSGSALDYATFLGGPKDDYATSIDVYKGKAIIAGYSTEGGEFPVTSGVYGPTDKGGNENFIAEISVDGSNLEFATYLGGSGDDFAQKAKADLGGSIWIVGSTRSEDYPVTDDAYDPFYADTAGSGGGEAFISKLSSDGSELLYSTYFGGSDRDAAYGLDLDRLNDIYVVGYTFSENFPVTPNAYDTTYSSIIHSQGRGDVFMSKFTNGGKDLVYSTYVGGRASERAFSVVVDTYFNAYATGMTASSNFPLTRGAVDIHLSDTSAGTDAFVLKLDSSGSELLYSSFLGGFRNEFGKDLDVWDDYYAYVVGSTSSTDYPVSNDPFDAEYSDAEPLSDCFLTKLTASYLYVSGDDKNFGLCRGDTIRIGVDVEGGVGALSYEWEPAASLSDAFAAEPLAFPATSTTYTVAVRDSKGGEAFDFLEVGVGTPPEPNFTGPNRVLFETIQTYKADEHEGSIYIWRIVGGDIVEGDSTSVVKVKWTDSTAGSIYLVEEDPFGCRDSTDGVAVTIGGAIRPEIVGIPSFDFCEGDSVILDAGGGFKQYEWSDETKARFDTIREGGYYWVTVKDDENFVLKSDSVYVTKHPIPNPIIYGQGVVVIDSRQRYYTPYSEGSFYEWYVEGGEIIEGQFTDSLTVRWRDSTTGTLRITETTKYGCVGSSEAFPISIGDSYKPKIQVIGDTEICFGDTVILDAGYGFASYRWSDGERTRMDTITNPGFYWVAVRDFEGIAGMSDTVSVTVLPKPPKPAVRQIADSVLQCVQEYAGYQWFFKDSIILGANEKTYKVVQPGVYKLRVENEDGCHAFSESFNMFLNSVSERELGGLFELYPNPSSGELIFEYRSETREELSLIIFDYLGREVFRRNYGLSNEKLDKIDLSSLPKGVYLAKICAGVDCAARNIILK